MPIFQWKRSEIIERMNGISPPQDMKCFYLTDSAPGKEIPEHWFRYGLMAWQIAREFDSFTINGYSGNMPVDFTAFDPYSANYQESIGNWIRKHHLEGVYSYDVSARKWERFSENKK